FSASRQHDPARSRYFRRYFAWCFRRTRKNRVGGRSRRCLDVGVPQSGWPCFRGNWFRFGRRPTASLEVRVISMIVGIIFAGLIFCLFKAIETIDVPTAILSYFTYPLLTGLTAALAGLEPLRWKGMICAVIAFCGLALLIEARPAGGLRCWASFMRSEPPS